MCGYQQDSQTLDMRPEFCLYRDNGCEFGESCLSCPLPVCVYDEPGGKRGRRNRAWAMELAREHVTGGKSTSDLATIHGVSRRTVQRALKTVLGKGTEKEVSRDG